VTEVRQKIERTKRYPRTRLDERQLHRIATIVDGAVTPYTKVPMLSITVVSADGEQTLRAQDALVFLGDALPSKISKVGISAGFPDTYPAAAYVSFDASRGVGGTYLSVGGTRPEAVHSLFHELNRELEAAQLGNDRLVSVMHWAVSAVVGMTTVGLAMACLVAGVDVLRSPGISTWQSWVVLALLALAMLATMTTSYRVFARATEYVSNAFPGVEFAGRLADSGLETRSRINWTLAIIIVPALVALSIWILTVAIGSIQPPAPPK